MILRRSTTLLLATIMVTLAPATVDLVFCLGTNGHSEIELATMGNCFDCFDTDNNNETSLSEVDHGGDSENHCGSCTDLVLSPEPSNSSRMKISIKVPILSVALPRVGNLPIPWEREARLVYAPTPLLNHRPTNAMGTVILLI